MNTFTTNLLSLALSALVAFGLYSLMANSSAANDTVPTTEQEWESLDDMEEIIYPDVKQCTTSEEFKSMSGACCMPNKGGFSVSFHKDDGTCYAYQ